MSYARRRLRAAVTADLVNLFGPVCKEEEADVDESQAEGEGDAVGADPGNAAAPHRAGAPPGRRGLQVAPPPCTSLALPRGPVQSSLERVERRVWRHQHSSQ